MRSILALSVAVLVGAGCGGGDDSGPPSSSPAPPTAPSSGTITTSTTTASGPQVVFHLKGKTPASDSVRGGGGSGKFTVSGTVTDSGTFVDYRRQKGETILIRRVLTGKDGKVTVVIHISTTEGDKGWKVTTGSGSYAGAQGNGEELGGVDAAGNIDITMNGSITGV
jgi:hypothetical protein